MSLGLTITQLRGRSHRSVILIDATVAVRFAYTGLSDANFWFRHRGSTIHFQRCGEARAQCYLPNGSLGYDRSDGEIFE
jgi:hypothetical protein